MERKRGSVLGPEVQRLAGCLCIAWRQRVFDLNDSIKRTNSDVRQRYHSLRQTKGWIIRAKLSAILGSLGGTMREVS